jgi:hypothetical protein
MSLREVVDVGVVDLSVEL